jgi:hypothetical protein
MTDMSTAFTQQPIPPNTSQTPPPQRWRVVLWVVGGLLVLGAAVSAAFPVFWFVLAWETGRELAKHQQPDNGTWSARQVPGSGALVLTKEESTEFILLIENLAVGKLAYQFLCMTLVLGYVGLTALRYGRPGELIRGYLGPVPVRPPRPSAFTASGCV